MVVVGNTVYSNTDDTRNYSLLRPISFSARSIRQFNYVSGGATIALADSDASLTSDPHRSHIDYFSNGTTFWDLVYNRTTDTRAYNVSDGSRDSAKDLATSLSATYYGCLLYTSPSPRD